jgi:hypothetical protein
MGKRIVWRGEENFMLRGDKIVGSGRQDSQDFSGFAEEGY